LQPKSFCRAELLTACAAFTGRAKSYMVVGETNYAQPGVETVAVTMKQKWAAFLVACVAFIGGVSLPLFSASADAWFTPHRGIYQMSLISAENSSGIVGASGQMYFEWTDTCDGWNVNQHTSLFLASSQEEGNQIGLTFSGWEAKDGLKLRFHASHLSSGKVVDYVEGEAVLSTSDGSGRVTYSEPKGVAMTLPEGTVFPSEYSRRMMKRMNEGESGYSALMFDGSSVDGTYDVTAFFAAPRMRTLPGAALGDVAVSEKVWPVRMAYFPLIGGDVEPDFEIGALINERGVAHRYDIDYGNFVVRAELELYEEIASPGCSGEG